MDAAKNPQKPRMSNFGSTGAKKGIIEMRVIQQSCAVFRIHFQFIFLRSLARMAIGALRAHPSVSYIARVLKFQSFRSRRIGNLLRISLTEDGVARSTVARDYLAVAALVKAVVAPIAAWENKVSDIVGMNVPTHFHFWKIIVPVYILD
jgi:hypothetical protein